MDDFSWLFRLKSKKRNLLSRNHSKLVNLIYYVIDARFLRLINLTYCGGWKLKMASFYCALCYSNSYE